MAGYDNHNGGLMTEGKMAKLAWKKSMSARIAGF